MLLKHHGLNGIARRYNRDNERRILMIMKHEFEVKSSGSSGCNMVEEENDELPERSIMWMSCSYRCEKCYVKYVVSSKVHLFRGILLSTSSVKYSVDGPLICSCIL